MSCSRRARRPSCVSAFPDFSEKRYGFNSFLSFAKAARARDLIIVE